MSNELQHLIESKRDRNKRDGNIKQNQFYYKLSKNS